VSKGKIIKHIDEGKYLIEQGLATNKIQEEISRLSDRIAELAVSIPNAKVEQIQASDAVDSKTQEINSAIDDLQAGDETARARLKTLQTELVRLGSTLRLANLKVSQLIAENLSLLKRRGQLEAVPEGRVLEAWCADYTLDLTGDVGLVDINDEGGNGLVIQPGYAGEGAYNADRDGALFPNVAQTGPQLYFNAAILPGVQKYLPRYRVGTITRLQVDLCDVILDQATSSAQNLPINKTDTLTDIPIVYMDCDGSAFSEGDRVIVRFTANGPLVVGFESEPVPCTLFGFVFEPAKYDGVIGPSLTAVEVNYGEPFESGGTPINDPLGTEGGPNSAWTATPEASDLTIERGKARNYGNKNWFNKDKLVLSWHGPPGIATRMDQLDLSPNNFQADWSPGPQVFHDLTPILDLSQEAEAGAFDNVFGASVYTDVADQRWLVVVAGDTTWETGQTFKVFRIAVDAALQTSGTLELLHETTLANGMAYQSHFYFSDSGKKAVCTIVGDLSDDDNLHIDLLRYDVDSGFTTEKIWDRSVPIGSRTTTDTYNVERDPPPPSTTITTGTLDMSESTDPHYVPIYCEYVGDREVIAYESRPGSTAMLDAEFREDQQTGIGIEQTGSRVTSQSDSGVFQVVTSDSNVLFSESEANNISTNLQMDLLNGVNGDPGHFNVTNTESAKIGGIRWAENLLAIDVRFGFCAAVVGGYTYSLSESISDTWDAMIDNGGTLPASGTITSDPMAEVVEVWISGAKVKEIEGLSQPSPIAHASYSSDVANQVASGGSHTDGPIDVFPQMPLAIGSKYLLTAAAYRTGPHSICSMAMNYPTSSSTRKAIIYNQVSGYLDPVNQILDRNEIDGYLLCSVGLV